MFTTIAYSESLDLANALGNIAAVTDDHIRTQGDVVYLGNLSNIIGFAAFLGSTGVRAQIQSPSLRRFVNPDISPIVNGLAGTDHDSIHLFPTSPLALQPNEGMEFLGLADPAAAEQISGIVFLADGAVTPVSGEIFTVRATGSITGSAGAWVSGNLTFSQTLPVGRYSVVGARVEGANLVAGRFIPIGASHRPGVIANADDDDREHNLFRYGGLGSWFEFDSVTPPSLEILASGANTAQVVYLDLVKVS